MNTKQVIVIRKDIKMSVAKLAVQVAHASQCALAVVDHFAKDKKEIGSQFIRQAWEFNSEGEFSAKKIVVYVKSEEKLLKVFQSACNAHIPCAIIQDNGLTELAPGTFTAVGIGPWIAEDIDKITGKLQTLK